MVAKNKPVAASRAGSAKNAQPNSAQSDAGSLETVTGINVRSFAPTFRRAGIEFSRAGQDFYLDDLTEEQVQAIAAEPALSVRGVELPALDAGLQADTDTTDEGNA